MPNCCRALEQSVDMCADQDKSDVGEDIFNHESEVLGSRDVKTSRKNKGSITFYNREHGELAYLKQVCVW